jgi:hypothetical protein
MSNDKPFNHHGLYSGQPPSTLRGEEVLALWHEHLRKRPVMRQSLAAQMVAVAAAAASQGDNSDASVSHADATSKKESPPKK